ncbi:MAG: hypothetical protein HY315_09535 [Acidobacteria bacterium]|nr:hypothetical protein [Acidobacteriota bacterium]
MPFSERIIVALAAILLLPGSVSLLAAPPQQAGAATSVNVGYGISEPGRRVDVPIVLEVGGTAQVGTTINEITFPNKVLSFVEANTAPVSESVNAAISTAVTADAADPAKSILKVTIASKDKKPIPSGVLASLVFEIAKDAAEATLTLKNTPQGLTAGEPARPIQPIAGRDGEIKISPVPPVTFACFFYMH